MASPGDRVVWLAAAGVLATMAAAALLSIAFGALGAIVGLAFGAAACLMRAGRAHSPLATKAAELL